jgi:transposase
MDKREHGHRSRGLPVLPSERRDMRFVGIDIGAERHVVGSVDERGTVLQRPTAFREDAEGYQQLLTMLGSPADTLVLMEATGHYWQNLFATLVAEGLPWPSSIRCGRGALPRKIWRGPRPMPSMPSGWRALVSRNGLRSRSCLRSRRGICVSSSGFLQDFGDRTRQLHRAVDLSFPEFTRYVVDLDSPRATALLHAFPTRPRSGPPPNATSRTCAAASAPWAATWPAP